MLRCGNLSDNSEAAAEISVRMPHRSMIDTFEDVRDVSFTHLTSKDLTEDIYRKSFVHSRLEYEESLW